MYSVCMQSVCIPAHSSSIKVLHTLSLLLQTWFVGEVGCDTGGVTRELWRLLAQDIMGLCDGVEGNLVFRHDSAKIQVLHSKFT